MMPAPPSGGAGFSLAGRGSPQPALVGRPSSVGGRNGRAAQDRVTVVQDGSLASGYAPGRAAQINAQFLAVENGHAVMDLTVGAELDTALDRRARRLAAGPHRADRGDLADAQGVSRTDSDGVRDRLDRQHIPGPAVWGRAVQMQALALADGEAVDAVVRSQHCPVSIDDRTRCGAELAGQEA